MVVPDKRLLNGCVCVCVCNTVRRSWRRIHVLLSGISRRRTKARWCRICSQIITIEVATVNAAWDINTSHDTPVVSRRRASGHHHLMLRANTAFAERKISFMSSCPQRSQPYHTNTSCSSLVTLTLELGAISRYGPKSSGDMG